MYTLFLGFLGLVFAVGSVVETPAPCSKLPHFDGTAIESSSCTGRATAPLFEGGCCPWDRDQSLEGFCDQNKRIVLLSCCGSLVLVLFLGLATWTHVSMAFARKKERAGLQQLTHLSSKQHGCRYKHRCKHIRTHTRRDRDRDTHTHTLEEGVSRRTN